MASPFKRFGRALGSFRSGLKQRAPALPEEIACSSQPVVAHPHTGQLILEDLTIQPEEGMYSVFSLDGFEILVRYSKNLAYTLPQGPSWNETGMVFVSPKLEALNLHKGSSFTVFVGRLHYLVTVIEVLANALPIASPFEHTRLPDWERDPNIDDMSIIRHPTADDTNLIGVASALEYLIDAQQDDHNQFLTPEVIAPRPFTPPSMTDTDFNAPKFTLRSASTSNNPSGYRAPKDEALTLQQPADPTNASGVINTLLPALPISPKTPKRKNLEPGRAPGRYPLTPVSNSNDRPRRSAKHPLSIDPDKMSNFQCHTIAAKDESQQASPSLKQCPIRPRLYRSPSYLSCLNDENRPERSADPQTSTPTIIYTSLTNGSRSPKQDRSTAPDRQRKYADQYPKVLKSRRKNSSNIAEPATSRKSSTDNGACKGTSKRQSPSATHTKGGRIAQSEKMTLPKSPPPQNSVSLPRNADLERERLETLLLTPKFQQPQSLTEEYYHTPALSYSSRNHNRHSALRPVPPRPQARPPSRSRSSSLPSLSNGADETNATPRSMPPIGAGRRDLVGTLGVRPTKLEPVLVPDPVEPMSTGYVDP